MACVALASMWAGVGQAEAESTPACVHEFGAREFRPFAQTVWSKDRWQRGQPKQSTLQAGEQMRACAVSSDHRVAMRHFWREAKRRFTRYRLYREVAPYSGGGKWWAIPYSIVSCESGGSWSAYNPSGAEGPYQMLGWPVPWPVPVEMTALVVEVEVVVWWLSHLLSVRGLASGRIP